ncbi:hypothetical protein [uncultured Campylobacter sp.]|uniref:hypothetical protein n=1 Tax=uncultured Campylobacter sp. TaxID=218934 RepID=UPI002615E053|nr:hypothetical protein [uncultured Campylobacter sp.]
MSECGINSNEYEWTRAWANTSKFNNCEQTQTRTRAKFNESGSGGQNLIKGAGAGKIFKPHADKIQTTSRICDKSRPLRS